MLLAPRLASSLLQLSQTVARMAMVQRCHILPAQTARLLDESRLIVKQDHCRL